MTGPTDTDTDRYDHAVETFQNAGLTPTEAKVWVLRELEGVGRSDAAEHLGMSPTNVDTHHQNAKGKDLELPHVTRIETDVSVKATPDQAVDVWLANGAKIRYRADSDEGTVYEEVFRAGDPDTVHSSDDLELVADDLKAVALESIKLYLQFRTDIEALREKMPNVFEAITLYPA